MMLIKSYSFFSHPGPTLALNEDGLLVDGELGPFGVFDGMGGGDIGPRTVEILKESVLDFMNSFSTDADKTMPFIFDPQLGLEQNALVNAINQGHSRICEQNQGLKFDQRGAVSYICGVVSENKAFLVYQGNCLGLLIRNSQAYPLALPQSSDRLSFTSAPSHTPLLPLRPMGMDEDFHYQQTELSLRAHDKIALLTDGIFGKISMQELSSLLGHELESSDLALEKMSQTANERGNYDNQSAVVIHF